MNQNKTRPDTDCTHYDPAHNEMI